MFKTGKKGDILGYVLYFVNAEVDGDNAVFTRDEVHGDFDDLIVHQSYSITHKPEQLCSWECTDLVVLEQITPLRNVLAHGNDIIKISWYMGDLVVGDCEFI